MKTAQDWSFTANKEGLVKPKLQDNKIFHALTSAYENNQQQELYGATEIIVKREKELCEMALLELKKLSEGKAEKDGTLNLILDHYKNRLDIAKEKETKINLLTDDSRKMTEEYKKKNQELAEVKRDLMDSQAKLRELAKSTEKLIKKEEELRFIESNLKEELENNKRSILNGLYEIVSDLPDHAPLAAIPVVVPTEVPIEKPIIAVIETPVAIEKPSEVDLAAQAEAHASAYFTAEAMEREENGWVEENGDAALAIPEIPLIKISAKDLWDKGQGLKRFEPSKITCAKSLVKTAEGEIVSEFYFLTNVSKEKRHYIFNVLYAMNSLLALNQSSETDFLIRLELIFNDLLNRTEQGQPIHFEDGLISVFNGAEVQRIIQLPKNEQTDSFIVLAGKTITAMEELASGRDKQLEDQLKAL